MQQMPIELLQRVAAFSRLSGLQSLVLLNSRFYQNLISMMYRVVHITSLKQTIKLCDTMMSGRSSLGLYPRSLGIEIKDPNLVVQKPEIQRRLRGLLLAIDNVIDLTLDLRDYIIGGLFNQELIRAVRFKLRRFACTSHAFEHGLAQFLRRQKKIETLVLLEDTIQKIWPTVNYIGINTMLPLLSSITGGRNLLGLVPKRSVSCIGIGEGSELSEIAQIASVISQASVPLIALSIKISVFHEMECDTHVTKWLESLSHCHESLEKIEFCVYLTNRRRLFGPPPTEPFPISLNLKTFNIQVRCFVALRSFTLKSAHHGMPQLFEYSGPDHEDFDSWRVLCPSLEFVSLFEREISSE
ncbi:hypothetical protein FRC12_009336 [Ceratobasidium sp. 428]|nr:hypothetical protein FRC12_009336 [Ceratobasidium sp. 428]